MAAVPYRLGPALSHGMSGVRDAGGAAAGRCGRCAHGGAAALPGTRRATATGMLGRPVVFAILLLAARLLLARPARSGPCAGALRARRGNAGAQRRGAAAARLLPRPPVYGSFPPWPHFALLYLSTRPCYAPRSRRSATPAVAAAP